MKKQIILTSTIINLLALVIAFKAEATPRVYESGRGLGVAIGKCFVQFDHKGNLLEGGRQCDDVQLHDARGAVQQYIHQHSTPAQVYESGKGLGVAIGQCFVQFDHQGTLLEGGRQCDDVQLHDAKQAVQKYLQQR
jgi:hypothetical protein